MISVSKIEHKGDTRILLNFSLNDETKAKIKAISGSLYSSTHIAWHIPYTKESWKEFLKLDLPYQKQITGTTGSAKPISDHAGKKIADVPPTCTEQAADKIPISIKYYHPLFFVRGELTQHQIAEIKKVKNAYWNPKFGNWVLPATQESLDLFYQGLKVIKQNIYEQWSNQVASIIQPKVCTLYRSPEYPDKVLVDLKGHGVDVDFLKHIPERHYQSNNKYWVIPDDSKIIQRITEHYTIAKTKIINRLNNISQKHKEPTYDEIKNYYLTKTPTEVRDEAERYLNTLIKERYSRNTIKEYHSKFVKFAMTMSPVKCCDLTEVEVNAYLAKISGQRISESLINGYINSIKFYYEKVIYLPDFKVERIKRPRKVSALPKVLSLQETDRLLRATHNLKHTTLLYALYGHGIRLNEVLSLRLNDMLWDRNQVFVKSGKGNKDRYIIMSQEFKEVMSLYVHVYKPQYWLFEGVDQINQYSERSVQEVVKQAARKAGIKNKVTPHTLRHCYATHLLDTGIQLPYIKELLGHKDIHPVGFSKKLRSRLFKYIFPLPDFRYFSRLVASC